MMERKIMENLKPKNLEYYMSLRYKIILIPEEDGWGAAIPDLPGCVAAGDTIPEALVILEDAKQSWITASLEHDLPIPEPTVAA
jgi:antitoxin HicB